MTRSIRSSSHPQRASGFSSILIIAAVLVAAFGYRTASAQPAAEEAPRPAEIIIHTDTGDHVFTVEWALTPEQRQLGLMFRQTMADDAGMVFDFFVEQPVSFWMRNTLLPLDMIFIRADGTVRSIAANTTPLSLTGVPSGGPVRYVLEVNAGTVERLSIDLGDRVDLGEILLDR